MTVKELQRLQKQELLQLLVEQGRAIVRLKEEQEKAEQERLRFEESNEHLGRKVSEKDLLIEKLQERLKKKEEQIQQLGNEKEGWRTDRQSQLDKSRSVAEAAFILNGFFESARRAADQYLYNVRLRAEMSGDLTPVDIGGSEE